LVASLPGYGSDRQQQVKVGTNNARLTLVATEAVAARPVPPKVGGPAPELAVAQWVNGNGVKSLSELRGKVVVLQFASSYKPAARASNEALKSLHARLRETGRSDVAVLAVYDAAASPVEVAAYAKDEGLPFPIGVVEETRNLGIDSAAFKAYGVRQLPTLF